MYTGSKYDIMESSSSERREYRGIRRVLWNSLGTNNRDLAPCAIARSAKTQRSLRP